MPKAKSIDRLELTRRKFRRPQKENEPQKQENQKYAPMFAVDLFSPETLTDFARFVTGHYEKCPICGKFALIHVEGCERCIECGYDACAWREV